MLHIWNPLAVTRDTVRVSYFGLTVYGRPGSLAEYTIEAWFYTTARGILPVCTPMFRTGRELLVLVGVPYTNRCTPTVEHVFATRMPR